MKGQVHTAQRHDSALKHVTGQALYIDDIAEPPGTLHAALVGAATAGKRAEPAVLLQRRNRPLPGRWRPVGRAGGWVLMAGR